MEEAIRPFRFDSLRAEVTIGFGTGEITGEFAKDTVPVADGADGARGPSG